MKTGMMTHWLLVGVVVVLALAGRAVAAETHVALYPNGVGMVQHTQPLTVAKGKPTQALVADLPVRLDPASLWVVGKGLPALQQQHYEWQPLNRRHFITLMDGQMIRYHDQLASNEDEQVVRTAKLLGALPGSRYVQVKDEDGTQRLIPHGWVQVDTVPATYAPHPVWQLTFARPLPANPRATVGYKVAGWDTQLFYKAYWRPQREQLTLSGWVQLTNPTQYTFKDAALTLMTGDYDVKTPQRYPAPLMAGYARASADTLEAAEAPMNASAETMGNGYALSLPYTATLLPHQSTTLAWLQEVTLPARSVFTFAPSWWVARPTAATEATTHPRLPVQQAVRFVNQGKTDNAAGAVGTVLPAGRVDVLAQQTGGTWQLVGQPALKDTPAQATVMLPLGESTDVHGEKWTDTHERSKTQESYTYHYRLVNRSAKAQTVTVKETPPQHWQLVGDTPNVGRNWHWQPGLLTGEVTVPAKGSVQWTAQFKRQRH